MRQDTEIGIWIGAAAFLLLTAIAALFTLSPNALWSLAGAP